MKSRTSLLQFAILTLISCLRLSVKAGDEIDVEVQKQVAEHQTLESKIEYLSSVISETNDLSDTFNARKASAIALIGNIGGTNAINLLVTNISFTDKRHNNSPASDALAKIGEPSVSELLNLFQNSSDSETLRRAAQTIALIKGGAYREFIKEQRGKMPDEAWGKLSKAPVITIIH